MHISSYYDCSFCAVYMQFICSVFYEIMKCYMQTTILHIHSTEVRPKAKWNQSQKKQQKPKTKSQESSEAKAKSQMGMQIGSKLQQIARKSEILAPKCSKYKPEARNRRSQKPKAKSQKPKARSQKPKKKANKKMQKKIPLHIIIMIFIIIIYHYLVLSHYNCPNDNNEGAAWPRFWMDDCNKLGLSSSWWRKEGDTVTSERVGDPGDVIMWIKQQ